MATGPELDKLNEALMFRVRPCDHNLVCTCCYTATVARMKFQTLAWRVRFDLLLKHHMWTLKEATEEAPKQTEAEMEVPTGVETKTEE